MDLKLDNTNDLSIVSGDIETITGINEDGQRIKDRLMTFTGEWFMDLSFGVDYIGKILIKNARQSVSSAHIRTAILKSVTGKITAFSSSLQNRELTASYTVKIGTESITDEITI
jgi:hypothetical protein